MDLACFAVAASNEQFIYLLVEWKQKPGTGTGDHNSVHSNHNPLINRNHHGNTCCDQHSSLYWDMQETMWEGEWGERRRKRRRKRIKTSSNTPIQTKLSFSATSGDPQFIHIFTAYFFLSKEVYFHNVFQGIFTVSYGFVANIVIFAGFFQLFLDLQQFDVFLRIFFMYRLKISQCPRFLFHIHNLLVTYPWFLQRTVYQPGIQDQPYLSKILFIK